MLPDARQGVQVRPQRAVGRAQRRGAARAAPRRARAIQVPDRRRARPRRVRERLGGRAPERRAALPGVVQRRGADGARGVHDRAALPDLRRQAAQAREPGGAGARPQHRRRGRTCRSSARSSSSRASRCASDGTGRGGLDPEIAGPILKEVRERLRFLARRRPRLSHARPRRRVALRRRGAAHPAGDADRLAPGGRALHPRRAVHRAAPARQRAAAGDAAAACATWATRSSSWSTTRRPSRGRPRHRPRARAPGARRRGRSPRARSRTSAQHPSSLTGRYLRGELRIPVPGGRREARGQAPAAHRRGAGATTCRI